MSGLTSMEWQRITDASWRGGSPEWQATLQQIIAEREQAARDAALAPIEALTYASDDGAEREHNGHASHEGEPECPGCWSDGIRAAIREARGGAR